MPPNRHSELSFNYPRHLRFRCHKCATCCGNTSTRTRHILLLETEAQQISQTTRKPVDIFATATEGTEPYTREMRKDPTHGKCFFLRDEFCTIYQIRPLVCRFYPFELTTKGENHVFLHTTECLGIGRGNTLPKRHFETLLRKAQNSISRNRRNKPQTQSCLKDQ